jgi:hypothetical protein
MPRQQAYSTIDGSTPSRRKALLAITGAGALMLVAASA